MHTDASNFQLGAVISQKVKPITLCNIKPTITQKWYMIMEDKLLSIVETPKEFELYCYLND